jgi:hypothetical protein
MIKLKDLLFEQPTGATMAQVRKRAQELKRHVSTRAELVNQLEKEFPDADYDVIKFIVYTKGGGLKEANRPVTAARRKEAQKYVKGSSFARELKVTKEGFQTPNGLFMSWEQLHEFDPIPAWLRSTARAASNKYIAQFGEMPPGT